MSSISIDLKRCCEEPPKFLVEFDDDKYFLVCENCCEDNAFRTGVKTKREVHT